MKQHEQSFDFESAMRLADAISGVVFSAACAGNIQQRVAILGSARGLCVHLCELLDAIAEPVDWEAQ